MDMCLKLSYLPQIPLSIISFYFLYLFQTKFMMAVNAATASWNKNLSVKFGLGVSLFTNALLSLGTERHLPFYEAVWDNKVIFFE